MASVKTKEKAEFGDFQTPADLARKTCQLLARRQLQPASIVEPTCGKGSFLAAALQEFSTARHAVGLEINEAYVVEARIACREFAEKTEIIQADFFAADWPALLDRLPEPVLVIGNPPWVTSADLGSLGSDNHPEKTNLSRLNGIDAVTGKANFDISEWIWLKLIQWLDGRDATVAMLSKTTVARRVLSAAWKNEQHLEQAAIYLIDASQYFNAAVDACLLVCDLAAANTGRDCAVFSSLDASTKSSGFGYRDGLLLSDTKSYEKLAHLKGEDGTRWRSGVKHDCSKVMELRKTDEGLYRN
ncbi:MAG: N-6 DNA methylase, partial [Planctomycetales bacterium]